jgi:hypothetical protein
MVAVVLFGALGLPAPARAQLKVSGLASTGYFYDSNVFALPGGAGIPTGYGSSSRADNYLTYLASLSAVYKWSQQELDLQAQGDRSQYQLHSQLDHEDYLFKGALNWKLGSRIDGILSMTDTRSMVPFQDIATPQITGARNTLYIDDNYVASGTINALVTSVWKIGASATRNEDDSPRPGEANLKVRETNSAAYLNYLGFGPVSAGLRGEYLIGGLEDVLPGEPSAYHQVTIDLTSTYVATGLSSFNGAVGYTHRSYEGGSYTASGVTGSLAYNRALTAKTSVAITLSRLVNTDVSLNGSSIDTAASLGVTWRATSRIGVHLDWSFDHSTFESPPAYALILDGTDQARADRSMSIRFGADYRVLDWLLIQSAVTQQQRRSSINEFGYNDTLASLKLQAHFH